MATSISDCHHRVLTRREDVLTRMQAVMGDLPDKSRRVPLDVVVMEETVAETFVRRKLTFAVEPGDRCWAWLFIPRQGIHSDAGPGPAMLCLHQTTPIGKDEPAGLGGKPNLHYARELAQHGYVTLAPDYPNFGEYRVDPYALGYASATMKAIWNHIRSVDLLAQMREVDPGRIGCIGHSLGGHNSLFLAAFDPRIQVTVSSCGFTLFRWNNNDGSGEPGDVRDWSHAGYMPRIAERYGCKAKNMPFDFNEVLEITAPRAIFINAPTKDSFAFQGVRECLELVAPEFERHGASNRLVCRHPNCEHDFPAAIRDEAYWFIDCIFADN
ncbi:MAG: alpha/beta fold hydrolase [Verrucomicrobia bacterium]|nr:alpha/beta fold hydrolase [Verrucomicrobiota bacterium]